MTKIEKPLYTAVATAIGGRNGSVKSEDGVLDVAMVPPKALGGPGGAPNPEILFAAGYSSCFGSALAHVAQAQKITTGPVKVTARVTLGQVGQGYGLAVELQVALPELPREQAQALVDTAHKVCPYSNATRGNIDVTLTLV